MMKTVDGDDDGDGDDGAGKEQNYGGLKCNTPFRDRVLVFVVMTMTMMIDLHVRFSCSGPGRWGDYSNRQETTRRGGGTL